MCAQFRLAPDLAEPNYSVTGGGSSYRTHFIQSMAPKFGQSDGPCVVTFLYCLPAPVSTNLTNFNAMNNKHTRSGNCVSNVFNSHCRKKLVAYVKICIMQGTYNTGLL
jgi:hypothetical protein